MDTDITRRKRKTALAGEVKWQADKARSRMTVSLGLSLSFSPAFEA